MLNNKGTKLVASAVTILLTLGMIGCGNVNTSEEASTEQVNIDTVTSDVAEAAKGDTIEDTSSTIASTEEAVTASTEASSEEVVEAVIETSTSEETTENITVEAVANVSTNTETETISTETVNNIETSTVTTSAYGTPTGKTGANGWPVIHGYAAKNEI